MSRVHPDPKRDPTQRLRTFYYEQPAPGWPEVILCEWPLGWPPPRERSLAIFCETDPELIAAMEAIVFKTRTSRTIRAAANDLRALCSGPSVLDEEGVAIYAPTVLGAPWIYVEAVADLLRPSLIRGRYSWNPFVGLHEALAHMDERHRILSQPPLAAAAYRLPSMILPTLPSFMPGPWE
jgi:hypothetical protein